MAKVSRSRRRNSRSNTRRSTRRSRSRSNRRSRRVSRRTLRSRSRRSLRGGDTRYMSEGEIRRQHERNAYKKQMAKELTEPEPQVKKLNPMEQWCEDNPELCKMRKQAK